jgi:hypothetical protein
MRCGPPGRLLSALGHSVVMDAAQKYAYRYLIYNGMLRIRPIAGVGERWWQRWNLFYWLRERKRIRSAGEVADWLHNLALFSAIDFSGFDEDIFWSDLERLGTLFPNEGMNSFTVKYSCALFEFNQGRWPTLEEQKAMFNHDDHGRSKA